MSDLTPLERERMTTIFRMTSLGINVRPLFILGLGLHHCISFVRPFDGRSYGEYHGRYTPRVSRRSPMQHLLKRRGWEKGEVTERCQQPARGENTNDDDEMITFVSWQLRTVTVGQLALSLLQ